MNKDTTSPSAAVLRSVASSVALDLAHAPLKSKHHDRLTNLTKQYVALEKSMTHTSEMVTKAMRHADELIREAKTWRAISEEGSSLASGVEQSMNRVSGVDTNARLASSTHNNHSYPTK